MPVLWSIDDEVQFHQAAVKLAKLRQTPRQEVDYRQQYQENYEGSDYTLSFKDEMQLADHIAFIAHGCEGFPEIAAVCIEEQPHQRGLIVRLARNKLRHTQDVESIRGLLQVLEDCANRVPDRSVIEDRLFAKVLAISEHRILQRLMPSWYPAPSHWDQRKKRTSLRHRMKKSVLPAIGGSMPGKICQKLTRIVEALEPLGSKQVGIDLSNRIRAVVEHCADASSSTEGKSLELQLKLVLNKFSDVERKTVAQIDKIARYFNLCKDLTKVVMKRGYRNIFQHITLEPLLSPPSIFPKGAAALCSVHAEVQLILHYERTPCALAPRFIGCSKSACFLCDLLIQQHGRFHVSFSHQRIYPKWTVPNVDWMTNEQTEAWRRIISDMIRVLQGMIQRFTMNRGNALSAPMESRACLPLSSVPSSVATPIGMSNLGTERGTQVDLPLFNCELLRTETDIPLKLSYDDLPVSYTVSTDFQGFHFVCNRLTVFFEFDRKFLGTISLVPAGEAPASIPSFSVEDLSCMEDLSIKPIKGDKELGFQLQVGGMDVVRVEFTWGSA